MDSAVVKNDGERSTSIYNSRSFPDNLREVYQVRSSHHDLLFSIADVTLIRINNNIRLSRITFAEDGSWATRRLSRLKRCSSPTVLLEHATIVSSRIISWRRIESYKRPRFNLHRGRRLFISFHWNIWLLRREEYDTWVAGRRHRHEAKI